MDSSETSKEDKPNVDRALLGTETSEDEGYVMCNVVRAVKTAATYMALFSTVSGNLCHINIF